MNIIIQLLPIFISLLSDFNFESLNKILIPVITGFPILLSVLDDILVNLKLDKYPILNILHTILSSLKVPQKEQISALIFNNLLYLLSGIVFFIYYYFFGIIKINLFQKLLLLFLQLIVTLVTFVLFPKLIKIIV